MTTIADYHMHSNYSDGIMTPTELVKRAKGLGLATISITDHDGIDGVKEGIIAGNALDVNVISGIEFSVEDEYGLVFHLLGYNFDPDDKELNETMILLKGYRKERNEKLIAALQSKGINITYEDVQKVQGKNYIGKPNIARALQMNGYVQDWSDAFKNGKLLDDPEIDAIQRKRISAERAIKLIRAAGGSPVLAHPGKLKKLGNPNTDEFYDNLDKMLKRLKIIGLKGLECYHPSHSHEQELRFVALAEKYHLHVTQGSDFHG